MYFPLRIVDRERENTKREAKGRMSGGIMLVPLMSNLFLFSLRDLCLQVIEQRLLATVSALHCDTSKGRTSSHEESHAG